VGSGLAELITKATFESADVSPTLVQLAEEAAALLGDVAAETPVLVVIDDLHWADSATLELLALLAARSGDRRVLIVVAHRELDHGDAQPAGRRARRPGPRTRRVAPHARRSRVG
jgi:hypothetical protein